MSKENPVIALLGQPNSGKSTLFNGLTGSRQKVGNWPGKTVEQKEGRYLYKGINYTVIDLPGSYSLSANSDEEIVTRDYIADGQADLVCILADASQLERSLYMLADFAGIQTPAILLLNMMDVAADQGKKIDTKEIEKSLGIPVIPFVAADLKSYDKFLTVVESAIQNPAFLSLHQIESIYQSMPDHLFCSIKDQMPEKGIGQYTPLWLAVKAIEGDSIVCEKIKQHTDAGRWDPIPNGSLLTGECKFKWIDSILKDSVIKKESSLKGLGKFDRLATSRRWGRLIAIGISLLGLILSMVIAMPIMAMGSLIKSLLTDPMTMLLSNMGASDFIISFVCGGLLNAVSMTVSMVGFVFGITLVFGLIEEIGYMARISFVFDHAEHFQVFLCNCCSKALLSIILVNNMQFMLTQKFKISFFVVFMINQEIKVMSTYYEKIIPIILLCIALK